LSSRAGGFVLKAMAALPGKEPLAPTDFPGWTRPPLAPRVLLDELARRDAASRGSGARPHRGSEACQAGEPPDRRAFDVPRWDVYEKS
jgi:hypothetical protein